MSIFIVFKFFSLLLMILYNIFTFYVFSPLNTMTGSNYLGGVYILWFMIGILVIILSFCWLYYFLQNNYQIEAWISGGTAVLSIAAFVWFKIRG